LILGLSGRGFLRSAIAAVLRLALCLSAFRYGFTFAALLFSGRASRLRLRRAFVQSLGCGPLLVGARTIGLSRRLALRARSFLARLRPFGLRLCQNGAAAQEEGNARRAKPLGFHRGTPASLRVWAPHPTRANEMRSARVDGRQWLQGRMRRVSM
jgi:hypothetical protein